MGPLSERLERFENEFDHIRTAVVKEPRGSDVIVGGLLCEPYEDDCDFGTIFFNDQCYLGMCGHGTIGLIKSLEYLGKIKSGLYKIDTPVGPVEAELFDNGEVRIGNVESYRTQKDVKLDVEGYGSIVGDLAWGGNWFFLVKEGPSELLHVSNVRRLEEVSMNIRKCLEEQRVKGENGELVEHIELFGPPESEANDSRNFVLCSGTAYDRSPCGTGTSAKIACLAADGKLGPGEVWRQEGILGSVFSCSYKWNKDMSAILPSVIGTAHITGEAKLILDPNDPFCHGISKSA